MVACVVTLAVIALVCIWITNFHLHIGLLLVNQWKRPAGKDKEVEHKTFRIPQNSTIFKEYYNNIQDSLKKLAGMDDFLTG